MVTTQLHSFDTSLRRLGRAKLRHCGNARCMRQREITIMSLPKSAAALLLLSCAAIAAAEPPQVASQENAGEMERAESPLRLGFALGLGSRTNPLIQSDDIPLVLDVDIAWFGSRWFFDNGDIGVAIWDDPRFTTNLVARVNSDRVFFGKTNSRFVSVGATGAQLDQPVDLKPPDRDSLTAAGAPCN
jgi:hypothetical protein